MSKYDIEDQLDSSESESEAPGSDSEESGSESEPEYGFALSRSQRHFFREHNVIFKKYRYGDNEEFPKLIYSRTIQKCLKTKTLPDAKYQTYRYDDELDPRLPDISLFRFFKYVNLACSRVSDVRVLRHVHTLWLHKCSLITDISWLGNVKSLGIGYCPNIRDFSVLRSIPDVTMMGHYKTAIDYSLFTNTHKLRLSDVTITDSDLVHLRRVHSLQLDDCKLLTTLSMLKDCEIQDLYLDRLKISDVSMLGHIPKLKIRACYKVVDVRALKNVKDLSFISCHGFTDVSMLGGVEHLSLFGSNVGDVSVLANVRSLDLSFCHWVMDVSALGKLHTLKMLDCIQITDFSALGLLYELDLTQCNIAHDQLKFLGNIHTLILSNTNVTDVSELARVHTLDLSHCRQLTNIDTLKNVYSLNLNYTNIEDVSMLTGVKELYIKLDDPIAFWGLKNITIHN